MKLAYCYFAAALALPFCWSPRASSAQSADHQVLDSVITNRNVFTRSGFEIALAETATRAGVPPGTQDEIRREFETRFARRVVPLSEWRNYIMFLCYRHDVPFAVADKFVRLLRDRVESPIDVGFLEQVRKVDVESEILAELVRRNPDSAEVRPPMAIFQPLPQYTEAAREDRIEGVIVLQADILEDGSVANVRVTKPLGYGLDESAVLAVQERWKFRPGQLADRPVDVRANIEVSFRLY